MVKKTRPDPAIIPGSTQHPSTDTLSQMECDSPVVRQQGWSSADSGRHSHGSIPNALPPTSITNNYPATTTGLLPNDYYSQSQSTSSVLMSNFPKASAGTNNERTNAGGDESPMVVVQHSTVASH